MSLQLAAAAVQVLEILAAAAVQENLLFLKVLSLFRLVRQ
jgi:hypothetical protein